MIEPTDEMFAAFEDVSCIPDGVALVLAIVERDYVVKPRSIRLTPRQIELLTDIATKPAMYITKYSQWSRTAHVLISRGLAYSPSGYAGAHQYELRITDAGRTEATRRGLMATGSKPGGAS